MLKVALTGGIGSGKSLVANVFRNLDIPVYLSDVRAAILMDTNKLLSDKIYQTFGDDVVEDGIIDRAALAKIVFSDSQKLDLLNSIVHPIVFEDFEEWFNKQKSNYCIFESAVIFENNYEVFFDKIICVHADMETRIHRVMKRDGVMKEDVMKRISNQLDSELKKRNSDYIIFNSGKDMILGSILKIHKELIRN